MNRQEMFTRAVLGLRSQGWARCMDKRGGCSYDDGDGKRCAWGHVDPSLSGADFRNVSDLFHLKVGVASTINSALDLAFAAQLQTTHDVNPIPSNMESEFRCIAQINNLIFPESA